MALIWKGSGLLQERRDPSAKEKQSLWAGGKES